MIHDQEIRVRYGETDQMGVVHHSVYALYFEEARTELLRDLGLPYAELERRGAFLPVVELGVRFRSGPSYDALLVVQSRLTEFRRVRLRIDYRVIDSGAGTTVAEGHTVHACTDAAMKPRRMPEELEEVLRSALRPGEWE